MANSGEISGVLNLRLKAARRENSTVSSTLFYLLSVRRDMFAANICPSLVPSSYLNKSAKGSSRMGPRLYDPLIAYRRVEWLLEASMILEILLHSY